MKSNKFLLGGIVGGIAYFLLGWVVWGMLLKDFMNQHSTEGARAIMRADKDMIWWAMIVGNLAFGFLLSFVCSKSNVKTPGGGAATGAIIGLLACIAFDTMMYSMMNMSDTTLILVDMVASIVVGSIVGAVIGWVNGMGAKTAT